MCMAWGPVGRAWGLLNDLNLRILWDVWAYISRVAPVALARPLSFAHTWLIARVRMNCDRDSGPVVYVIPLLPANRWFLWLYARCSIIARLPGHIQATVVYHIPQKWTWLWLIRAEPDEVPSIVRTHTIPLIYKKGLSCCFKSYLMYCLVRIACNTLIHITYSVPIISNTPCHTRQTRMHTHSYCAVLSNTYVKLKLVIDATIQLWPYPIVETRGPETRQQVSRQCPVTVSN